MVSFIIVMDMRYLVSVKSHTQCEMKNNYCESLNTDSPPQYFSQQLVSEEVLEKNIDRLKEDLSI